MSCRVHAEGKRGGLVHGGDTRVGAGGLADGVHGLLLR